MAGREGIGLAEAVAAHAFGIATADLPTQSEARSVAAYLAHRMLRIAPSSRAAAACKRIEARRRDPQFDRMIGWLETLLRSAVAA